METIRLSSKGQIVIPKDIRSRHRWAAGTELIVEDRGDQVVLRPVNAFAPTKLEDGLGCAGYVGSAKTQDQMDEAVATVARRDWVDGTQ